MNRSTQNTPYNVSSAIDLIRVIGEVTESPDHHLFYLGLNSPNDVENCGNQEASDVSRNPLTALFFACVDNSPNDGEIIIYNVPHSRISRSATDDNGHALMLTERGTFIFLNNAQCDVSLLATDKRHNNPLEIIIDSKAKSSIIKELDKLGISMTTLFPEMDGTA